MNETLSLEQRIKYLEARESIKELIARYCMAIDDRNLAVIETLFTPDGSFRSKDGVLNARGLDKVMEQFRKRFAALGPTNHFTHDHIISLDKEENGIAYGLVSSHAEVVRNKEPMLVALRYEDVYMYHDDSWKFKDRLLSFFYYMKASDYTRFLGDVMRIRAYDGPRQADYPELLDTWKEYYGQE